MTTQCGNQTSKRVWSIRRQNFRNAEAAARKSAALLIRVHFCKRFFLSLTFAHSSASGGAGFLSMSAGHSLASCAFMPMNSFSASGTSSSAKIASTGHSGTHSVQSMHSSGSITSMLGPSRKQSTGHTSTQSVYLHFTQDSVTTYVMFWKPRERAVGTAGKDCHFSRGVSPGFRALCHPWLNWSKIRPSIAPGSPPNPSPGRIPRQSPKAKQMSEKILHVTDDTFEQEVLQSQTPVLVDYWAEWCGPCKMIAPVLDQIATDYAGRLKVAKLNIDENQVTPPKYNVRGIPTLMLFKNGTLEAQKVGALSKTQLAAFIDSNI